MRLRATIAAIGGAVLAATLAVPAPATSQAAGRSALWSSNFAAQQTAGDCGRWRLDDNDFCVANDARNGLEIGVRFKTAQEVEIIGVRIYRVDPANVRGSLWDSSGALLARGQFGAYHGNGWQDMTFAEPVTVVPGERYVASYFTPGTKYAFDYQYFKSKSRTVGPVTALRSKDDAPNGVHCYDDANCGEFPVWGYRNSTYWVTPLWRNPVEPVEPGPPGGDPTDRTPPRALKWAPQNGATGVGVRKSVRVKLSEKVRRSSLKKSTVRLMQVGSGKRVAAKLRYQAKSTRVVIDPRSKLKRRTKYRVVITTRVRDLAGNRLDQRPGKAGRQKATWTFRTK